MCIRDRSPNFTLATMFGWLLMVTIVLPSRRSKSVVEKCSIRPLSVILTTSTKLLSPCSRLSNTCQNCGSVCLALAMAAAISGSSSPIPTTLSRFEQAVSNVTRTAISSRAICAVLFMVWCGRASSVRRWQSAAQSRISASASSGGFRTPDIQLAHAVAGEYQNCEHSEGGPKRDLQAVQSSDDDREKPVPFL